MAQYRSIDRPSEFSGEVPEACGVPTQSELDLLRWWIAEAAYYREDRRCSGLPRASLKDWLDPEHEDARAQRHARPRRS